MANEGRPSSEGLPVADKRLDLDASPAQAGKQREVRVAVERQRPKAPAPPPPREVAGVLMEPTMFGVRDLAGRTLDQRGEVVAEGLCPECAGRQTCDNWG